MKSLVQLRHKLAAGGLSLVLLGGVGLPLSAFAQDNNAPEKSGDHVAHHEWSQARHDEMLSRAYAEDAELEKLAAQLNSAPDAEKVKIEAEILTKLVDQHHRMLQFMAARHGGRGHCHCCGHEHGKAKGETHEGPSNGENPGAPPK